MPHHSDRSTLRPRNATAKTDEGDNAKSAPSNLRTWTAIKILKYGIEKKLCKKKGWLFQLLVKEGLFSNNIRGLCNCHF
jgi:hypothetical protein